MFPITAGLGALSYLTSLLQSSTASTGSSQSGNPLGVLGQAFGDGDGDKQQSTLSSVGTGGSTPPFNPGMLASLISLQGQQSGSTQGQGPSGLFAKLDTDGDGQISKSEFENALGSNGVDTSSADALFNKLDTNGDGSVSQDELAAARHGHHHHHAVGAGSQNGLSSLLNATNTNGAKTQTTSNADGSSTTTITYADGSTVSTTTPASNSGSSDGSSGSSNGSSGSSSQANLLEQLIKLQSQVLSQQTSGLSTVA